MIEVASHDPQQGTIFYTLDQGVSDAPQFVRGNACLTCHISASTLDVPGPIDRSNRVGEDGRLLQRAGPSVTVNHETPHTQRWGGWFVTSSVSTPPYQPLGHLGNLTAAEYGAEGDSAIGVEPRPGPLARQRSRSHAATSRRRATWRRCWSSTTRCTQ